MPPDHQLKLHTALEERGDKGSGCQWVVDLRTSSSPGYKVFETTESLVQYANVTLVTSTTDSFVDLTLG